MALAPVVAAALNVGLPTRIYGLTIDGLDVIKQPGTTYGSLYGVAVETIRVTEAGPGQVSAMTFTIDDPAKAVTLVDGQVVAMWDYRVGTPLFLGFIQSWTITPWGLGRQFDVECVGIEVVLDWTYSPQVTLPNLVTGEHWQALWAQSVKSGYPMRACGNGGGGAINQVNTVANIGVLDPNDAATGGTVPAGTLRQAYQYMSDQYGSYIYRNFPSSVNTPVVMTVSVDFWGSLRVQWVTRTNDWGSQVTDWASGTVVSSAGAMPPASLRYTVDSSGAIRGTYVTGTGATSAAVSDGTGVDGQVGAISDTTITSNAAAASYGAAYMARTGANNSTTIRGTFVLDWGVITQGAPGAEYHAGSTMVLTNAELGVTAQTIRIGAIEKEFTGAGKERWTITFGGTANTLANSIRRLTRSTIS